MQIAQNPKIDSLCVLVAERSLIVNLLLALFLFSSVPIFGNNDLAADVLGICASLACIYPLLVAAWHRNLEIALSAVSLLNLAPLWFLYLESLLENHDARDFIDPDTRVLALLYATIFQAMVNGYYLLFRKRVSRFSTRFFGEIAKTEMSTKSYFILTLLAFMIPLVVFTAYYGSVDQVWTNATAGRASGSGSILKQESIGNSSSLLLPIVWLWQLPPVFGIIAFTKSKTKLSPIALIPLLLGGVIIFVAFLSGSRGNLMYVGSPYLFFLVYYNWRRGVKFWLALLALFFCIIAVMEIQVRFRANLLDVIMDPDAAAKSRQMDSITTFDPTKSHRDNNMYIFCLAIKGYPSRYEFEGYNDLVAVLVNPIPRYFWPDKPVLVGAKGMEEQPAFILDGPLTLGTTSLSMSVIGEAYRSGGLIGLAVYSFIYGLFGVVIDGLLRIPSKSPVLVALLAFGVFLSFWGFRSFFALVTFLYPFLLIIAILRFIGIGRKLL